MGVREGEGTRGIGTSLGLMGVKERTRGGMFWLVFRCKVGYYNEVK